MFKFMGYLISFIFVLAASFVTLANAGDIYYEEDFNSGTITLGVANPVWSLPESAGLTIGSGNIYEVVS